MVIDIFIIALVVYFAIRGYSKGLIRSLIHCVANIGTTIFVFILAKTFSGTLTDILIRPILEQPILDFLDKNINYEEILEKITKTASADNAMIDYFLNLSQGQIGDILEKDLSQAFKELETIICENIMNGVSYILIFIVGIVGISIALNVLLKIVDVALKITSLTFYNKLLGAVLGVVFASVISYLLVWGLFSVLPVEMFSTNTADSALVGKILDYEIESLINFIK